MNAPVIKFPFNLQGPPEFVAKAQDALSTLLRTRTGKALIKGIADANRTVTIAPTSDANAYCVAENADAAKPPEERGVNSVIYWNPDHQTVSLGDAPGAAVILGSQLVRAFHHAEGSAAIRAGDADVRPTGTLRPHEERSVIGSPAILITNPRGKRIEVPDYAAEFPSENSLRDDLKIPRRAHYYPLNWPGGPPW